MKKKQMIIIFGSPNKNGQTKKIIDKILKPFNNLSIKWFYLYEMNILPCIDCKECQTKKGCFIKNDDMHLLYDSFKKTDIIIIASPIHFGSVSAKISIFISRFQTFWAAKFIRKDLNEIIKKQIKGFSIFTSGTYWPGIDLIPNFRVRFIFDLLKLKDFGYVCAERTDKNPSIKNIKAIEKGIEIMKNVLFF